MVLALIYAAINVIPKPNEVTELPGSCPATAKVTCTQAAALPREAYELSVTPSGIVTLVKLLQP